MSTSLYDLRGSCNRPGWPVPPEIALDHRYPGLVVTWIDRADGASIEQLDEWLVDQLLPSVVTEGSPVAQALVFSPRDFPGVPGTGVGVGDKTLVAWFVQSDPRDAWDSTFADLGDKVAASGLGTIGLAAPFIPVVPGTDTHLDELW